MNSDCLICGGGLGEVCLSLGRQTVTKNLIDNTQRTPFEADLSITICHTCATVQLGQPWPHQELVPWHAWMTFREPEAHLDDLVGQVIDKAKLGSDALIAGVSSKDDTTLARFERMGFRNTYRINPRVDLGVDESNAYIESVQKALTPENAKRIVSERGYADCVVVRHILEHAERPKEFLSAIQTLLKPGGVAVFEVPDCADALDALDYALIWEEHSLYFTQVTLTHALMTAGFAQQWQCVYPYPFENSLVVLANQAASRTVFNANSLSRERERFDRYCFSFADAKLRIVRSMASLVESGQPIVLFGAGHLGCSFINYYELGDQISFAVDDAPEKLGLKLPGSELDIRPSSELAVLGKFTCLLSVTPEKESAVVERLKAQLTSEVTYKSIVSTSPRYIGKVT